MSKLISTANEFESCGPIDVTCYEDKLRNRYTQQVIQVVYDFFSMAWMSIDVRFELNISRNIWGYSGMKKNKTYYLYQFISQQKRGVNICV